MNNWINFAYKKSKESKHKQHFMCSLVLRGGNLVSYAVNLSTYDKHAEKRALRRHMDYNGCTLVVVRSNKRCSKPCEKCMEYIKKSGISKVVYINENCQIEQIRI